MSYSLNEIEALTKRAARGAGLPWGLAEEAAMAARWLAAYDMAGPQLLVSLLTQDKGGWLIEKAPLALDGGWRGASGHLSPLITGPTLSDNAARLKSSGGLVVHNISHPLLMLPFAATAAQQIHTPISLEWDGVYVASDGNAVSVKAKGRALNTVDAVRMTCKINAAMPKSYGPASRGQMTHDSLDRLLGYAQQSFAPVTDESRKLGAGADDTDNN